MKSLSISVNGALQALKKESRFNQNDFAYLILTLILPIGFIAFILFDKSPANLEEFISHRHYGHHYWVLLPIIFIAPILIKYIRKRIKNSKEMMAFYEDVSSVNLDLNEDGITIPILIILGNIPKNSPLNNLESINSNVTFDKDSFITKKAFKSSSMTINWKDISKWESGYIPDNRYTGERAIRYFKITTEKEQNIAINRNFFKNDEEKALIDFARQFVKIDKNIYMKSKKERNDFWFHIIGKGIVILLLLALLIPYLFIFFKKYF
ncbi:MAG: hypothetical protein A3J37_07905 [Alphaproteobacteria bacterium RIFCSPHIGHO2_12_FULL_45_9]|nr:MAG: hypothetical protein A3B66_02925 [Alphaproteobacteria bacterium RIFCSPHIGHO2_02_FULL_46_13]OFW95037.1 MAG: hypothetical protein A3J37_07905 [Alphaproteobacteria bacterium RIFCSPHIGHO2_12_FULL_45_9]